MTEEMEREYLRGKLARRFYEILCDYKGWDAGGYIDPPCYAYADYALEVLGYDENSLKAVAGVK